MTDEPGLHCTNGHTPHPEKGTAKFCTICGAPMVVTCPSGHEVKRGRYCSVCGEPLRPTGLSPPAGGTVAAQVGGGQPTDTDRGCRPTSIVTGAQDGGLSKPPRALKGPQAHRRGLLPLIIVAAVALALFVGGGAYFGITQLTSSGSEKRVGAVPTTQSASPSGDEVLPPQPTEQTSSLSPTQPTSPTAPPSSAINGPGDTVEAYFAAINAGNYSRAWDLGGRNLAGGTYSSFVKSFEGTASDSVVIISVTGDKVEIELDATQADGTHRYFAGTYTVRDGVIVAADIQRK